MDPPPPLVLVPRRQRKKLNGQLDFLGEPAEILINPDDGAMRCGAVSIPHGHHGANVNGLTSKDDIDVVTGMVRDSGIAVSLHPA